MSARHNYLKLPKTATPRPMTARAAAWAYGFPLYNPATKTGYTGAGYTGGLIELGGGYDPAQIAAYFSSFTKYGYPTPVFNAIIVGQGANSPDGPNGADGEVQLDMLVAAAVAPGATWNVYFADQNNYELAIAHALATCDGVSTSWGGAENTWDPDQMTAIETMISAAKAKGVPFFAAAGDQGSGDDSGDGNQVDFPASSPSAIGCGGTRLTIGASGLRVAEVTWDDDPSSDATGGGVSQQFPGRQVPDIAGNADPDTGYEVSIDGQQVVEGGTSAVAPLMLAGHALLWEAARSVVPATNTGQHSFDYLGLLTGTPNSFFDVTIGNNGAYRAGPGRDDVTGLGVPNLGPPLAALLAKKTTQTTAQQVARANEVRLEAAKQMADRVAARRRNRGVRS